MEERQLSVEIDQIKEFEKSKRNSQTRIKYMEGYVSTSSSPPSPQLPGSEFGVCEANPNGPQQLRTVTRRQKEQLAQEYLDRNSMDQLHEARIKVLRERQEQQLQETAARLEKELDTLINNNAETIIELERDHQREEQEMLQVFDSKKNRLRRRWNIEEAILRKRLEEQNGLPYGPLPIVSFSAPDDDAGHHQNNNDREFLEFEIPILKNPFASTTK
jgi:DNA repair exonuclease SbcCD nuclease subunit